MATSSRLLLVATVAALCCAHAAAAAAAVPAVCPYESGCNVGEGYHALERAQSVTLAAAGADDSYGDPYNFYLPGTACQKPHYARRPVLKFPGHYTTACIKRDGFGAVLVAGATVTLWLCAYNCSCSAVVPHGAVTGVSVTVASTSDWSTEVLRGCAFNFTTGATAEPGNLTISYTLVTVDKGGRSTDGVPGWLHWVVIGVCAAVGGAVLCVVLCALFLCRAKRRSARRHGYDDLVNGDDVANGA
jgi:hypothetical protein